MPTFTPVDFDPFAGAPSDGGVRTIPGRDGAPTRVVMDMSTSQQPRLVPVDHDPFADGPVSTVVDAAKSFGTGLAKGAIGVAGLPGVVADYGARGLDAATQYVGEKFGADIPARKSEEPFLGPEQIQRAIEGATGEFYKPKTTVGQYAQTVGEFAPAALLPGSAVARAGQVLAPALTSETAGQLTKGTALEGPARFAGALVGGIGAGMAARPGTAAQAIRGQLPPGVTPQMVDQAEALIARAKQSGIDLSWPEALSQVAQRPVMTNTLRHLEASPQTEAQMGEFFARRPQQVEAAARGQFNRVAPINPTPSTIGPSIGAAAESAVNDVRGLINKAADPFYKASEGVLLSPQEMAQVRALPGFKEAADAVRKDPQLNRYVSHLPDNSVGFLNEVKKELDRSSKNAVGPLNAQPNMQRAAGLGNDATSVKNAGINASGDYEIALGIESLAREKYLKPLLDGPLGKIAKKDTATKDAINALFPKNPLPNSEHEINVAVSALAKRNPRAAGDLVRAHVESVFNNAAKDLQTGANQAGGAKFRVQLMGDAQQRLNLRSAIEALPNGAERWQGFNKFMDVMEAIGTRQGIGSRTAYNEQFLKEAGMGRMAGDAARVAANPTRILQPLVDRYDQWRLGRNLGQLADILTDPASANMLRAIARMPANSSKSLAIASRLAVYHNSARAPRN